jgi:hypothetical protein
VLGTFSKGVESSRALNFARSGGRNCDRGCRLHPENSASQEPGAPRCYADRVEHRPDRQGLAAKLERHEGAGFGAVVAAAWRDLDWLGWRLDWLRLSSSGSLPMPSDLERGEVEALRQLLAAFVRRRGAGRVHLPVESRPKALAWRRALKGVGVVVRESLQSPARWRSAVGAVSIVAGSMATPPRERVEVAKRYARERAHWTGRRVVVCPAVAAQALRTGSRLAKCGACRACALPGVDVVYPAHA